MLNDIQINAVVEASCLPHLGDEVAWCSSSVRCRKEVGGLYVPVDILRYLLEHCAMMVF